MKVGDLVKPRCPTSTQVGKVFLVSEWRVNWIRVLGYIGGWHRITDWEIVNASR